MSPIVTYNEVRLDGKRTFQLFEEEIVVHGKATFGVDFESAIPLSSLTPSFTRVRARYRGFFTGVWLFVGSWIFMYVIGEVTRWAARGVLTLFWSLGIMGLVLLLRTAKKLEWVQFNTDAGVAALTIARAGKERDQFESFVQAVSRQITVARSKS